MKGKTSLYYNLPNISRLRSRLEKPSKELTSELRAELQNITAEVLNKANLDIRARMIDYIAKREDLKFKNAEHRNQVLNLTQGIFDAQFSVTPFASEATDEEEAVEEAPGESEFED